MKIHYYSIKKQTQGLRHLTETAEKQETKGYLRNTASTVLIYWHFFALEKKMHGTKAISLLPNDGKNTPFLALLRLPFSFTDISVLSNTTQIFFNQNVFKSF